MSDNAAGTLKTRLRSELKQAMKDRRTADASLLRALLAAIDNAEAPAQSAEQASAASADFAEGAGEVARLDLSQDQLDALMQAEIAERLSAAEELAELGQADRADTLRAEAELVRRYLSGSG